MFARMGDDFTGVIMNQQSLPEDRINNIIEDIKKSSLNKFDVNSLAEQIKEQLGIKVPLKMFIGFNIASGNGDVVVLTREGYVFIPIHQSFAIAGGVWSNYVWLKLYYAQKNLTSFLEELGKQTQIPVVDRCLYIDYLLQKPEYHPQKYGSEKEASFAKKLEEHCVKCYGKFVKDYDKQIQERKAYSSWLDYNNDGFAFRYFASIEVRNAIDAIYEKREELERNGCWKEARDVIYKLQDILFDRVYL